MMLVTIKRTNNQAKSNKSSPIIEKYASQLYNQNTENYLEIQKQTDGSLLLNRDKLHNLICIAEDTVWENIQEFNVNNEDDVFTMACKIVLELINKFLDNNYLPKFSTN